MGFDGFWPAPAGVEEHGLHCVLGVSDSLFGDTVLEVSIYSRIGECLSPLFGMLAECVLGKASVVRLVVADDDSMATSVAFECLFRLDRLLGICGRLGIHISDITPVVNEDGRCSVSLCRRRSLELGDESRSRRLELVDRYALSGSCDRWR